MKIKRVNSHLERKNMALENKLNITDSTELARMEEKISKKKAVELFENGYLDKYKAGSFEMLAAIHKYLFSEIYDFAGKVRNVNIAKGNFRFAPVMYLQAAIENVEKMPQSTFDEIVEKSPIKDIEIKYILKQALTDKVDDREVYMKGIDHSYYYEGYVIYKAEDL